MTERLDPADFPDGFADTEALEEFMTRPSQALIDDLAELGGDIMVLDKLVTVGTGVLGAGEADHQGDVEHFRT